MNRTHLKNAAQVVAMVGVTTLALHCASPEAPEEAAGPHAHFTTGSALLVSERSSLELCLQVEPGLERDAPALAKRLEAGLLQMKEHKDWKLARFETDVPRVVQGCPGAVWPTEQIEPKDTILGPGITDNPSPFRTYVYVVSDRTAERLLGDDVANRAAAELMRLGDHQLAEVTTALVVHADQLESERFLEYWLPWSIGLKPEAGFDWETAPPVIDHFAKEPPAKDLAKPVEG